MSFSLAEDEILAEKYRVIRLLGAGWEGEVYLVEELGTGIERAMKLFFPHRNKRRVASRRYARKLHKLRSLPMLIQYHAQEELLLDEKEVVALVSEYIEGELLSSFVNRQPGKRLTELQAALLLYEIAKGVEQIHLKGEYHGDLHAGNIIVCRSGLSFDLKFLDFYYHGRASKPCKNGDIVNLIVLFCDALGGKERYSRFSDTARYICAGLRTDRILERFKTATHLRNHLEHMSWD